MLGEFLSANVSTPFVLDMVSGELLMVKRATGKLTSFVLGFDDIKDKSEVAAYTGFLGTFSLADIRRQY